MPNKVFNVLWSKVAAKDLDGIISFIAEDNLDGAFAIYSEIKIAASELTHFPTRGRVVPELEKFAIIIYREIIINVWRILYRIEGNRVYVLAVFDSRRNIEDLLLERFIKD
ncbi:MAG: type II toxin-antitoxin system RelE/ParE family toxin [Leptospirales bacterium]